MTGSGNYQTKPLSNFSTSYKKLVKKHYRKNRKARQEFEELVKRFLELVRYQPMPPEDMGHREPWPTGAAREGFELWKLDFHMPSLSGQAGEGRLIYLLDEAGRAVYPVWIYTHHDFGGRPPEKELARLLKGVMGGTRSS